MAKKKSAPKRKPVRRMYPEPTPIKMEASKVVSADVETPAVHIEVPGPPSPELVEAGLVSADGKEVNFKGIPKIEADGRITIHEVETDTHRMDLKARLNKYLNSCLFRTLPHLGDRPPYISEADWQSHEQRTKLLTDLPVDAPGEAHDALRAAKLIKRMVDELVIEDDWSDGMERVICMAIDLGKLLQRGQVQLDFGGLVAVGQGNELALSEASRVKAIHDAKRVADRLAIAKPEYLRRKAADPNLSKKSILQSMADVTQTIYEPEGPKDVPIYGSYGQLARDAKQW